jgi:hypothetical protein
MSQKQMRIGMSLRGHGYHLAAWRHPDVPADASVRLDHYIHTAQTAERGKCDLIEFIPIKPSAATGSDGPGSYAAHNRVPSRERGRRPSTAGSGL